MSLSLLEEFQQIQEMAIEENYVHLKKEFLEQVRKSPFQKTYSVGKNISSQASEVFVKSFIKDGFGAEMGYNADDNCNGIIVTAPSKK